MDKHLKKLNKMIRQDLFNRNPEIRAELIADVGKVTVNSANSLTKAIKLFVELKGYQAERIAVTGRLIDKRTIVTDILGHQRQIGSCKYIKSSMTPGTADISLTLKGGLTVKVEVKWGKDRQSEAQKKYQASIEKAGGIYLIIHKFEEFYEWYMDKYPDGF
jgi:hypothetical protein